METDPIQPLYQKVKPDPIRWISPPTGWKRKCADQREKSESKTEYSRDLIKKGCCVGAWVV
jgi:hypothetical protein